MFLFRALKSTKDDQIKKQLVLRISQSAERHAPNFPWFVETMKALFIIGKHHVTQEIANNFCEVLAQGTGEESMKDNQLRVHAFQSFHNCLQIQSCPPILLQVTCWIIGEFAHLSSSIEISDLVIEVSSILEQVELQGAIRDVIVTSLWKLLAHDSSLVDDVVAVLTAQRNCKSLIAQQTIYESIYLLKDSEMLKECLISAKDMESISVRFLKIVYNKYLIFVFF